MAAARTACAPAPPATAARAARVGAAQLAPAANAASAAAAVAPAHVESPGMSATWVGVIKLTEIGMQIATATADAGWNAADHRISFISNETNDTFCLEFPSAHTGNSVAVPSHASGFSSCLSPNKTHRVRTTTSHAAARIQTWQWTNIIIFVIERKKNKFLKQLH